jgi:hypothetical protein
MFSEWAVRYEVDKAVVGVDVDAERELPALRYRRMLPQLVC